MARDALRQQLRQNFSQALLEQTDRRKTAAVRLDSRFAPSVFVVDTSRLIDIQRLIRPLFGKAGVNEPKIGGHPSYDHLATKLGMVERGQITTMFLDIEGSTRLGIVHELEEVMTIKNTIVMAAMDMIRCFDGHVHRIMGDAVLAFFGGKKMLAEQGAIDALNCASVLRRYFDDVVGPSLSNRVGEDFGIRIGLDHGSNEQVLWSSYGYPSMNEVTATSFYVDIAAKLQHSAGRNEVMIGDNLRSLLDFPEILLRKKEVAKGGIKEYEPYVLPNHTDRTGKPVNYRKFLFNNEEYLRCTGAADLSWRDDDQSGETLDVSIGVADDDSGMGLSEYKAASAVILKGRHIRFVVNASALPEGADNVLFSVENHGVEASKKPDYANHETRVLVTPNQPQITHWEHAGYRGLHYMTVTAKRDAAILAGRRIGVYVE